MGSLLRKRRVITNDEDSRSRGLWLLSTLVEMWNDSVSDRCKHRGLSGTSQGVNAIDGVKTFLSAHISAQKFFERVNPDWFVFEYLPAYSPELNPVEQCWQVMKNVHLANFVPLSVEHLVEKRRVLTYLYLSATLFALMRFVGFF